MTEEDRQQNQPQFVIEEESIRNDSSRHSKTNDKEEGEPEPTSITSHDNEDDDMNNNNGALRDGDAPVYNSPEIIALLTQYACVGLIYGALGGMGYQLFIQYFHMEGYQFTAAIAIVDIGWSLKVFIGMLSDCVPIYGLRRKPYMIIGWIVAGICMTTLAIMDHGDPYFTNPEYKYIDPADYTPDIVNTFNPDAVYKGTQLSIIAGVVTIAYLFSDVTADALVVEYAQREPLAIRGKLQTMIYATRTIFSIIPLVVLGFGMNDETYGGEFNGALSINAFFTIFAVPCFIAAVVTYYFLKETPSPPQKINKYLQGFWSLVQKRAMWQVMMFTFLFNLLSGGITSNAAPYVQELWVGVSGLMQNIIAIVSSLIFAAVLLATGTWGTNWNWRYLTVLTTFIMNAVDSIVVYLAIYGIMRQPWFYMGVPLTEILPYGVQFMVTTFVIVELADVGNEGIVFGLLTTVSNLPSMFGSMITNLVNAPFDISAEDIAGDSQYTRNQVAYTYLIYYGTTVLACCCVVLLPRQKEDVKRLKEKDENWPIVGGLVLASVFCILIISISSILMSMFKRTTCLVFSGGDGCDI